MRIRKKLRPFKFFGFPTWIGMMCGLGLPLAGFVAYALRNTLSGVRLWIMIVVLVPVTIYGSEVIAWPMWITLNGGQTVEIARFAAILSLIFVLCAYYSMTTVYLKSRTLIVAQKPTTT
ncbi:MAG: hypothetical protein QM690_16095 [Sphingobium sp.]